MDSGTGARGIEPLTPVAGRFCGSLGGGASLRGPGTWFWRWTAPHPRCWPSDR